MKIRIGRMPFQGDYQAKVSVEGETDGEKNLLLQYGSTYCLDPVLVRAPSIEETEEGIYQAAKQFVQRVNALRNAQQEMRHWCVGVEEIGLEEILQKSPSP